MIKIANSIEKNPFVLISLHVKNISNITSQIKVNQILKNIVLFSLVIIFSLSINKSK